MKCNCCDKEISEKEIIWNDDLQAWEMCPTCLTISLEAAYSDGFKVEEDEAVVYVSFDDEEDYTLMKDTRYAE